MNTYKLVPMILILIIAILIGIYLKDKVPSLLKSATVKKYEVSLAMRRER